MTKGKTLFTNPKALQVLVFIRSYYDECKYPPCVREIGEAVGITSTSVVNYYLVDLHDRKLIKMTPKVARSYVPIEVFDEKFTPCPECERDGALNIHAPANLPLTA